MRALTFSSASVSDFEPQQQLLLEIKSDVCTSQSDGKIFEIMRDRNKFVSEESTAHSSGGFRDLVSFMVKVGFKVLAVDSVVTKSDYFLPTLYILRSLRLEHHS
jgi:hypothetical protein